MDAPVAAVLTMSTGPIPSDAQAIIDRLNRGPIPYVREAIAKKHQKALAREHNNPVRPDPHELAILLAHWPAEVACPDRSHTLLRFWEGFGFALDTHAGPPCPQHA